MLILWDTRTPDKVTSRVQVHSGEANGLSFNPFCEFVLATCGADKVPPCLTLRMLRFGICGVPIGTYTYLLVITRKFSRCNGLPTTKLFSPHLVRIDESTSGTLVELGRNKPRRTLKTGLQSFWYSLFDPSSSTVDTPAVFRISAGILVIPGLSHPSQRTMFSRFGRWLKIFTPTTMMKSRLTWNKLLVFLLAFLVFLGLQMGSEVA